MIYSDFSKKASSGSQEQFEIVTMTDELEREQAKAKAVLQNFKEQQKASKIRQRAGAFALEQEQTYIFEHQDKHPVLIVILLLTILGSVISMALSWWYIIYPATQLPAQNVSLMSLQQNNENELDLNQEVFISSPKPEEKENPEAIVNKFFMEQKYLINIVENDDVLAFLKNFSQQFNETDKNIFIRLFLTIEGKVPSISELLKRLNINLNPKIISKFNQKFYNLFVYIDTNGMPAYGAVLEIEKKEESDIDLINSLKESENQFIQKIENILGVTVSDFNTEIPLFKDANYKNVGIRYYNFKDLNFSLDYAIINKSNLFIFTTSKDSMFAAIDRIINMDSAFESYPQDNTLTSENENAIINNDQEFSE